MPLIVLALFVAAILGGGTSMVAQTALPGELLWSFKVNVNERIDESLAIGERDKAEWEISVVQKRFMEATRLASQHKLEPALEEQFQLNLDTHLRSMGEHLSALQANGEYQTAADIASTLQAALAKQVSVINEASAGADTYTKEELDHVMQKVRLTLEDANAISASASAKAAGQTRPAP